jgi:phosphatidylserine decarboxylase
MTFEKGDEIGRFKFGSTVILLFKEQTIQWQDSVTAHAPVQMGEKLASFK